MEVTGPALLCSYTQSKMGARMKKIAFATVGAISMVSTTAPAFPHHPFDPEFDWKTALDARGHSHNGRVGEPSCAGEH
jgi:hypothetical protein